ncbi:MAG: hypothetical protein V3U06_11705, partial [Candidatus Binatia bacterium]
ALGSDKGLDVLYSTPARFVSHAPCISGHLFTLASRSGEKCGLVMMQRVKTSAGNAQAGPVTVTTLACPPAWANQS